MNQFDEERRAQQHEFRAGLIFKLILLLLAAGVASLILLAGRWVMQHRQPPHCDHPQQAAQSTFPIDCR